MKLDNSALTLLSCARAFQLRVLRNMRPTPDGSMNFGDIGSLVHYTLEDYITASTIPASVIDVIETLSQHKVANNTLVPSALLGSLGLAIYDGFHKELFKGLDPQFIERTIELELTLDNIPITFVGTIDSVTLTGDKLLVTDFKTVFRADVVNKIKEYEMSSQLYIYMWMLHKVADQLPRYMQDAAVNGRLYGRYLGICPNSKPPKTQSSRYLYLDQGLKLDNIESMIEFSLRKALTIEAADAAGHLYPQEGRFNGACRYCDFAPYCDRMPDDRFLEWANERRNPETYNPTEHRKRVNKL